MTSHNKPKKTKASIFERRARGEMFNAWGMIDQSRFPGGFKEFEHFWWKEKKNQKKKNQKKLSG
ncbi:hypothetical protein [Vibrio agarivorans]|uniref:hypothetical protein n=1 Tax=Vibrio agarivorans TaxID=153622 RepID=UPI0035E70B17